MPLNFNVQAVPPRGSKIRNPETSGQASSTSQDPVPFPADSKALCRPRRSPVSACFVLRKMLTSDEVCRQDVMKALTMTGDTDAERDRAAFCAAMFKNTLPEIIARSREILSGVSSQSVNDADPFGDGDQSSTFEGGPGTGALKEWPMLVEIAALTSPSFSQDEKVSLVSRFGLACLEGDAEVVRSSVVGSASLKELLCSRHTPWRLSPLMLCVAGSQSIFAAAAAAAAAAGSAPPLIADHYGVACALLEAGAPPGARDAMGHAALHWATSKAATPASMRIAGAGNVTRCCCCLESRCCLHEPPRSLGTTATTTTAARGAD